jgi:hypothetical protein
MMLRAGAIALLTGVSLAAPALAHHSFAMFDRSRRLTLGGTVAAFAMDNPHSRLRLAVMDARQGVRMFNFEMGPPAVLMAGGWTAATLKPGDKVSVRFFPLRDGGDAGQFIDVKLAGGRVLIGGPKPSGGRGFDYLER